jgi:hypothetical protein
MVVSRPFSASVFCGNSRILPRPIISARRHFAQSPGLRMRFRAGARPRKTLYELRNKRRGCGGNPVVRHAANASEFPSPTAWLLNTVEFCRRPDKETRFFGLLCKRRHRVVKSLPVRLKQRFYVFFRCVLVLERLDGGVLLTREGLPGAVVISPGLFRYIPLKRNGLFRLLL